jgi:hypothetical protein
MMSNMFRKPMAVYLGPHRTDFTPEFFRSLVECNVQIDRVVVFNEYRHIVPLPIKVHGQAQAGIRAEFPLGPEKPHIALCM